MSLALFAVKNTYHKNGNYFILLEVSGGSQRC